MYAWMHVCMDGWMHLLSHRLALPFILQAMYAWMHGCMYAWMDGCTCSPTGWLCLLRRLGSVTTVDLVGLELAA